MLEAHRIRQRTEYDLEMMRELGFCSGIENYSRACSRAATWLAPVHPDRLLPGRLRLLRGRVAPDGAAARRHVRGRLLAQADARRLRLPPRVRARQPPAPIRRVPGAAAAARVRVRHTGSFRAVALEGHRAEQLIRPTGIADPGSRAPPDPEPDRRPPERDPHREDAGTRPRHDADEEDGGRPHRLPARGRRPRALPPLGDRHARADRDHPRVSSGRVRRARGRQPLREGLDLLEVSLVAVLDADKEGFLRGEDRARADDRARGEEHRRQGAHVRRQAHGGDRRRSRRRTPSRVPDSTTRSTGSRRRRS